MEGLGIFSEPVTRGVTGWKQLSMVSAGSLEGLSPHKYPASQERQLTADQSEKLHSPGETQDTASTPQAGVWSGGSLLTAASQDSVLTAGT